MKIAVVGGGPGGLYFAILMKRIRPRCEITIYERNAPDDTFGFGVVLSDETLVTLDSADPPTTEEISRSFARWDDIDVYYAGRCIRSGGHAFAAIRRTRLLSILQARALGLGVDIRFQEEAPPLDELADRDLVVASDGINSTVRTQHADWFRPTLERRRAKYMWLGTDRVFEAFSFHFLETPDGLMDVYGYPFDAEQSTFIVEMDERTWRKAGFGASERLDLRPGVSDLESIARCEELFADVLDGHALIPNNSKWTQFVTVRNERWSHGNVVLLGDAAHTAHYSVGSGTKLAMEDAIALAWAFRADTAVARATSEYEAERRPVVESMQRAAQASLEWFEGVTRYARQSHAQFAFNLVTRSRRITHDNVRVRDRSFVASVERDFLNSARAAGHLDGLARSNPPPMFVPFSLRGLRLPNRVAVSPMEMGSAHDGLVGDWHLVHLASRGVGGAGLVFTEMTAVAPDGRTNPRAAGIYDDAHVAAWRRIVDFIHGHGIAKVAMQLGHAGRKAATKVPWEGQDEPLDGGGWPLIAPSAIPYTPRHRVPREMTREDMDRLRDQLVAAVGRAEAAGFDMLELHFAHGYLLSTFLSPLTNRRTDEYGGSLENRARFPLEVLDACRRAWPEAKPVAVRISATDWAPGGFDGDQAVAFSRMLREHGCDIVDVSTGQVVPHQRPAYGRSYQTPFADRIRNEADVPTMAVGAISSYDDVNSIVLAGRADLCLLARTHLYDPYWTLHAAAEQEWDGAPWMNQYLQGRRQPNTGRDASRMEPRTFDLAGAKARPRWAARWRPRSIMRVASRPETTPQR